MVGQVATIAGSGVMAFADGQGTYAHFQFPAGVAVFSSAVASTVVYVTDQHNHRIRQITQTGPACIKIWFFGFLIVVVLGMVTTLAGSGSAAWMDGALLSASLYYPYGIAVDSMGSVYVADRYNHRIRMIYNSALPTGA